MPQIQFSMFYNADRIRDLLEQRGEKDIRVPRFVMTVVQSHTLNPISEAGRKAFCTLQLR